MRRDSADALPDWGVDQRTALGRAQAVLLGVLSAMDDEVQAFLDSVPWVIEDPSPGVDGGEAVAPGEEQS